jgi:hypothetical protein
MRPGTQSGIGRATQMGFAAGVIRRIGDVLEFEFHRDAPDGDREPIAVVDGVTRRIVAFVAPIVRNHSGGDSVVVTSAADGQFIRRQIAAEVDSSQTARGDGVVGNHRSRGKAALDARRLVVVQFAQIPRRPHVGRTQSCRDRTALLRRGQLRIPRTGIRHDAPIRSVQDGVRVDQRLPLIAEHVAVPEPVVLDADDALRPDGGLRGETAGPDEHGAVPSRSPTSEMANLIW